MLIIIIAVTIAGPVPMIIGGTVAKPGEIPYQVYSKRSSFSSEKYFIELFEGEISL